MLSKGTFQIFFTRPISATCLILTLILLCLQILPWLRMKDLGIALDSEEKR
jgi:TctA family transporter